VFCGAITWLKSTGITRGYTSSQFKPTKDVTRQVMAAFLHRYNQLPKN
jgi:hypothetical protein